MHKILFVCTGNICRSPLAQGIFTALVRDHGLSGAFVIDSAGTHAHFAGSAPDPYAQAVAVMKGTDISSYRSRRMTVADCRYFDVILAADHHNIQAMQSICPPDCSRTPELLMAYAGTGLPGDIPDPYGAGMDGFIDVVERIEQACRGLLEAVSGDAINVRGR